MRRHHFERHYSGRAGWLRAAVLGANDGILSTASLVVGVAAAAADREEILIAGIAGLVAGAMSMAAGEYVSVSSQADAEKADIERERRELEADPEAEIRELTQIYVQRGLKPPLAKEVALELTAHDALKAHARDELGLSESHRARPAQAAAASAFTFALGALLPLLAALASPPGTALLVVAASSLVALAVLGALAAFAGGSSLLTSAARVTFWGAIGMSATALIGRLVGAVI
ncbi:MAG: VIT family protein [Steroidobacteraceae bacterium]|jgi:VIT1/CCC1 family predicted Fe2+/Mn2+ transporter